MPLHMYLKYPLWIMYNMIREERESHEREKRERGRERERERGDLWENVGTLFIFSHDPSFFESDLGSKRSVSLFFGGDRDRPN